MVRTASRTLKRCQINSPTAARHQSAAMSLRDLLGEAALHKAPPMPIDMGALTRYDRSMPSVSDDDTLLVSSPCAGRA